LRSITAAALSAILAFQASAVAPASLLAVDPEAQASFDKLQSAPAGDEGVAAQSESTQSASYDTFSRVVANPFWGTSSSGFSWQTNNHSGQCSGYTSSVDGANGVMTGSAGATCAIWGSLLQTHHPGVGNPAVWKGASWTFSAEFKSSAVDGSRVQFGFLENFTGEFPKLVSLRMSATGSVGMIARAPGASSSAPFAFQANTWYAVKWVQAWGNQQRLKVWPAGSPEPSQWLLAHSLAGESTGYVDDAAFGVFYDASTGPTSSSFDNFSFGPAPILPNVPPPPGTEHNPPHVNQTEAGDPVSTYTGSFSDAHLDIAIPGRGPTIEFARTYNSNDSRATALGPGWTHSYNIRLVSPGDGSDDVILIGPQGRSDRYVASGGSFTPPPGVRRSLVRNADETYTATDRSQLVWSFDPSGRLTQIRDRFGNASNLTYNAAGELVTISDPAGRGVLTLDYTNGRLTWVSDWASPARVVGYQYDANGRLWKVTDREGKTTTFGYEGATHRLTTITDARNNVALTLTYDPQGRVGTQKDARGLSTGDVTTFSYVTNPDGTRSTTVTAPATSYEPTFNPSLTDAYDPNGWLLSRTTRPSASETYAQSFTYDGRGNRTSGTDGRGNRTDFCYDVDYAGNPISGGGDNLTRRIDPAPASGASRPVTLLHYDTKHNVIQTVAPEGVPSGATVTCSTNLSAVTITHVVDFTYDGQGAALLTATTRFTDPDTGVKTAVTKYEYSDAANPGLVTRVIPPRGNTGPAPDYAYATSFTYYATGSMAGLLKDVTDALGNRTSYAYDPVGRVTSIVDPLGNATGGVPAEHTTTFAYDREDRLRLRTLPAPVAGATGLVDETRYDAVGNPIVRIDANGQVTTFNYDARNSLTAVTESPLPWTDPANLPGSVITTEYVHDAGGNVTRIKRAAGDSQYERVTDYVYDGRGLLRRELQYPAWPSTTGPLVTEHAYDPNANRLTTVDPLGQTTTFGYDRVDRLTSIDYSDPATPDAAFAYDANGNRIAMTDGTGSTSYAYDEADRPTAITSPGSSTVGYRYDLDGNRTKLIYPDATAVTYAFNKGGQLSSLADWASRSITYSYAPDGLVVSATNPNGSVATYNYDNARRLIEISHIGPSGALIDRLTYQLDPVGNVIAFGEGLAGPSGPTTTSRASVSSGSAQQGNAASSEPAVSTDGRYVAFASSATNLVSGDTNGNSDVFVRDRLTGVTRRVSVASDGTQANGNHLDGVAISADGRYVAFTSYATNLVPGDTNGSSDVFVHDRQAATTTRASVSTSGAQTNDASLHPQLSADGRFVAFASRASNLVTQDKNRESDIFVRDLQTNTTTRVSVSSSGAEAKSLSIAADISADGRHVVFTSYASNLVSGDTNGAADIFIRDRQANTTSRVSLTSSGSQANGASAYASISGDGQRVAFESTASNLVSGDTNAVSDVFLRDLAAGSTQRASVGPAGAQSNAVSDFAAISGDGSAVAFRSVATNLVAGDSNGVADVFVRDLASNVTSRASVGSDGSQGNQLADGPAIGTSGATVVFRSLSSNLVPADTNGVADVFVRAPAYTQGDTRTYDHDRLYRLTGVTHGSGVTTFGYDPAGNRVSVTANGIPKAFAYDRADRITAAGPAALTVNANGNLTARGADTFAYDQANRLTSATVAGDGETYAYDGDGTRFSRQAGSNPPIRYISDTAALLPVTISDGTRKYVYGLGLAYAVAGSAIEVYHTDHLGSVRALTDASGTAVATYRTDEWGVPVSSSGSSNQPFGFTGEPRDASGLSYLRSRYYDPNLGRFLSRDTWVGGFSAPQSLNRYAYVRNNPVRYADPSGHCGIDLIADLGFSLFSMGQVIFGPDKERGENFGYLLLDVGGIFIPCGAGAGTISRVLRAADSGLGNVGGGMANAGRVLDDAQAWLGPGYREIAPGVFRSADGTRQFRMTTSDLSGPNPHVHFESIASNGRTILENSHVYVMDP
jgi:RHS repeat-associated protein